MGRSASRFAAFALTASFFLSACGGASHSIVPNAVPTSAASAAPSGAGQAATATFAFTFPKDTSGSTSATRSSAGTRAPKYLSSATKSIAVQVTDTKNAQTNADIYANVAAALKAVQIANFTNLTGNPNTAGQCGTDPLNAGNYKCTAAFQLPIGINTITIASWDATGGTGNKLSQQSNTYTTVQGSPNSYSVSLDANVNTMTVTASAGYCASSINVTSGATIGTVGTSPVTFAATFTDADGKTIVAPGLPKIQINGSSTSGTIVGTGGNVNFTINQSAGTFSLTATTAATTASIPLTAVPPNAGDGLTYSKSLTFTMSSGPAPPSSFLAVAQQAHNSGGAVTGASISLYTINTTASTFTAYSPASLANTNPGGGNDVDYPNDLAFDGNGDLLIANGGAGSPDLGNFACIPAGSISTGANNATVLTANNDDPTQISLNADSSATLLNGAGGASFDATSFTLSGIYGAAPAARDITHAAAGGDNAYAVAALPATVYNPAGSYAVGMSNGTSNPQVWIQHPDGTHVTFTDGYMYQPTVAYDAANNQLVVLNDGRSSSGGDYTLSNVEFWDMSTATPTIRNTIMLDDDGSGHAQAYPLGPPPAVSSDGHVAIIADTGTGQGGLLVYDGTSARAKVDQMLDFGATTTSGGATYVWGNSSTAVNIQNKVLWLTASKLLLEMYSQSAFTATSVNGLMIFDITQTQAQTGYDVYGDAEPTPTYKEAGFQSLTNSPYSAAFKP